MMHFGYVSTNIEDLPSELAKPFTKISVRCMKHGQPMSATLWRLDGTGLEISSEVHDAAEKCEIGNLCFAIKSVPREIDPFFPERDYPSPFATNELEVVKLTIFESGSSADGGVILADDNGKNLMIIAAAYPFCIATKGISPELDKFAPEYDLEEYLQEKISSHG